MMDFFTNLFLKFITNSVPLFFLLANGNVVSGRVALTSPANTRSLSLHLSTSPPIGNFNKTVQQLSEDYLGAFRKGSTIQIE